LSLGLSRFGAKLKLTSLAEQLIFAGLTSTAHTGILSYATYDFLIANFGNQDFAGTAEWSFVGHFAIFTFIALMVQIYYAHKITSFCSGKRRVALVGGIVVLALAQSGEFCSAMLLLEG
jgi:hypothetical protein